MYFEADFFSGEDTWNLPLSKALSQLLLYQYAVELSIGPITLVSSQYQYQRFYHLYCRVTRWL